MTRSRSDSQSGLTFVEMIATAAILLILSSAILPVSRTMQKRTREIELRRALREIRTAIDEYHSKAPVAGRVPMPGMQPGLQPVPGQPLVGQDMISPLENKAGMEGYPATLEALVEGVPSAGVGDKKLKFLRRIPVDPMTHSTEWGLRCYQDEPDSTSWCGKNVYDVYTTSEGVGLDGTKYAEW